MKLLLDTHLLLWTAADSDRLSSEAEALIADPGNDLLFSAASLWEIIIKRTVGRADFRVDPRLLRRSLLDNGYLELPIESEHVMAVESLPAIHSDPFDRILVAQAIIERVTLITSDRTVAQYSGPVRKV
jgi:PIN domain nuclease of toxin-antitoxin system